MPNNPINVKVAADEIYVTYEYPLKPVNSPYAVSQFGFRGLPEGLELLSAGNLNGQLVLVLNAPIDEENLSIAGIVYKPGLPSQRMVFEQGNTELHFIPLSTATVTCKKGNCPPEEIYGTERDYLPLRITKIGCVANTLVLSFSEFISPDSVPPLDSFLINYGGTNVLADYVEFLTSISVEGRDVILSFNSEVNNQMSGNSIISYEPPAENFLRTMEVPYRIIRPFNFKLLCKSEDFNEDGECDPNPVHSNGLGIPASIRHGECATIEDYITMYSLEEAIQVSNVGNGGATEINYERMNFVLDLAADYLDGVIKTASWAGRAMLLGSFKYAQLVITRYMLHSQRRSKDIVEEYTKLLTWIDQAASSNAVKPSDCDGQVLGGGRVLIGGYSQQYNVENGLGLRGWMRMFDSEELFRLRNGGSLPDWVLRSASIEGIADSNGNRVV